MSDIYDTMPLTQETPGYEVWTASGDPLSSDFGGFGHFAGDARDLGDATTLMRTCQIGGNAAWILDKEGRNVVAPLPESPVLAVQ